MNNSRYNVIATVWHGHRHTYTFQNPSIDVLLFRCTYPLMYGCCCAFCSFNVAPYTTMFYELRSSSYYIGFGSHFYDVMVMIVILLFIVYPFSQSDFAKFLLCFHFIGKQTSQPSSQPQTNKLLLYSTPLCLSIWNVYTTYFVNHCWNCLYSWKVMRKRCVRLTDSQDRGTNYFLLFFFFSRLW